MTYRYQKTLLTLLTFFLVGFSWLGGLRPVAEANVTLLSFDVARSTTSPKDQLCVVGDRDRNWHGRLSCKAFHDRQRAGSDRSVYRTKPGIGDFGRAL